MIREFRLPDLGEGLTESELVQWRVAEGEEVTLHQVIAEVETAKAMVELPSPHAGVVERLYVGNGTTVNVGEPIIAFRVEGGGRRVGCAPAEPRRLRREARCHGAAGSPRAPWWRDGRRGTRSRSGPPPRARPRARASRTGRARSASVPRRPSGASPSSSACTWPTSSARASAAS